MSDTDAISSNVVGSALTRMKQRLRGRLATRTLLLFIVGSLVPVALTGAITIWQTTSYFEAQAVYAMRAQAKGYGLQLFERLTLVSQLLREADGLQDLRNGSQMYFRYIDSFGVVRHGRVEALAGDARRLPGHWSESAIEWPTSGNVTLRTQSDVEGRATVYLLYRPADAKYGETVIAAINYDYLWRPLEMAEGYGLCVGNSGPTVLYCSREDGADSGQTEYVSAHWSLFLGGAFNTSDWSISIRQSRSAALAAVSFYKRLLLFAMLGTLALITLLVSINLRRSHKPLEQMIAATRRIAGGKFNEPLQVMSGDEYEELSHAFNAMSERLDRQFRTIAVLGKIDRFILESNNIEPVIETMLTQSRSLLGCDLAAVALFDIEVETLGRLYLVNSEAPDTPQLRRINWPVTDMMRDGSEESGYIVTPSSRGQAMLASLWDSGLQQCLLLPIVTRARVNALFVAGYSSVAAIEATQRQLARDLSDRLAVALASVEREQELFQQAHYDALTRLPNRLLFKDRLEQELAHARRDASSITLLFIDLDRFKQINDSLGHAAGDQLLRLAAGRFGGELRDIDTIARLGGDEFTIIAPRLRATADISRLCERLLHCLARPFVIDEQEFFVSASIGVAMYPNSGLSADVLLRNADTAMYRAKTKARGSYAFYEESMNREIQERALLESQLRQALLRNELELYYQPKVDLASGSIVSVEALLRWNHPDQGLISPARFVPIAEETGMIVPIGEWVINMACLQLQAWRSQGILLNSIAANVSVSQLHAPDFVKRIQRIMLSHQIQPGMLELELTESTLAADIEHTVGILSQLSEAGVRLAIDDFGTGYSSLKYLQRLPINVLKIDRAFMPRHFDGADHVICDAVLALARTMGKTVVAEGIETAEQMLYLQGQGCHIGQGYFFGTACSSAELTARLVGAQQSQPNSAAM